MELSLLCGSQVFLAMLDPTARKMVLYNSMSSEQPLFNEVIEYYGVRDLYGNKDVILNADLQYERLFDKIGTESNSRVVENKETSKKAKHNTANKRTSAKKGKKIERKGRKVKLEPIKSFEEKLKLKAQGLKVQIEKQEEQELVLPFPNQFLFDTIPTDPNSDPYINNIEMSLAEGMKDSELKDKLANLSSPGINTL